MNIRRKMMAFVGTATLAVTALATATPGEAQAAFPAGHHDYLGSGVFAYAPMYKMCSGAPIRFVFSGKSPAYVSVATTSDLQHWRTLGGINKPRNVDAVIVYPSKRPKTQSEIFSLSVRQGNRTSMSRAFEVRACPRR